MHHYGDSWPHWNDLHTAIYWCIDEWRRRARLGSHGKEKWGVFRHHPSFYSREWPIHSLIKPGYVYYQWPRWIMPWEFRLGATLHLLGVPWLIQWYQYRVYRQVLREAVVKWPHIEKELTCDTQESFYY